MYGYIYLTTNIVNNKQYIGQKKSSKFLADKYLGSGVAILRAIRKYGADNFKVEMLATADSQGELDELEVKYISEYRNRGASLYNIADGGYTTGGYLGNTTKGKVWVNNGQEHIMINEFELSNYLNQGYSRGSLNTKGYIWITNGKDTKHMPEENLPEYIELGYKRGRGSSNKMWITNGIENRCINTGDSIPEGFRRGRTDTSNQPAKNKKYMYKDDEQVLVEPGNVDAYLSSGYTLGKHPRSSIKGKPGHATTYGFRWLTNGFSNVFTNSVDLYLNMGYIMGRTFNSHSK